MSSQEKLISKDSNSYSDDYSENSSSLTNEYSICSSSRKEKEFINTETMS